MCDARGTSRVGGGPPHESGYEAWLRPAPPGDAGVLTAWRDRGSRVARRGGGALLDTARRELCEGLTRLLGAEPATGGELGTGAGVVLAAPDSDEARHALADLDPRADEPLYRVYQDPGVPDRLVIAGATDAACLYGVFHLLRLVGTGVSPVGLDIVERTPNRLRMLDHWDNPDGSVERGYAGRSIFFDHGDVVEDLGRVRDYARLVASVGVNAVAVNNVNVGASGAVLLTDRMLPRLAGVARVLREYGIRMFLSVDFASPVLSGDLHDADPTNERVVAWWRETARWVYGWIPDFGGWLVKADSESTAGPAEYGRTHAEGANALAAALAPYGGLLVWRAFVYDCHQDWRDHSTDRARACHDHFAPLDGAFADNVLLQIKNGPVDFQVREPVSPLFGALRATNRLLELQITQEYTGQQRDLCYLPSQWSVVLGTTLRRDGQDVTVARLASGEPDRREYGGIVGVANVGDDITWTGHILAQANLYGFGRLSWNPTLTPEAVAREWIALTFTDREPVASTVLEMLLSSWSIYEDYTAPLGVGWMVTPHTHYGPSVDGYEYSRWGTYHRADRDGVGVDRTVATGSGFVGQYDEETAARYERVETCPDELLLFFHHVAYQHRLHGPDGAAGTGSTVIQHIYDSHFRGAAGARRLLRRWRSLAGHIDQVRFANVEDRLVAQVRNAVEWCDVVNSYFFRKSGVPDEHGRRVF